MNDPFRHRLAAAADIRALRELMDSAIAELQRGFLSEEEVAASFSIMGLDTLLIEDGTYFIVESDGIIAGSGGWSRREVWRKGCSNASGNSLGALTRLGAHELGGNPDLHPVAAGIMQETLDVAAALGWDMRSEINVAQAVKRADAQPFRSSMLQDVLAGRPLEVEALIGQTQAFGRETGVATPYIDAVLPLLRGLDRSLRQQRDG